MYKIYINQTLFILDNKENQSQYQTDQKNLLVPYLGKTKQLLQYIDTAENSLQFHQIVFIHENLEQLKSDFWNLYKLVPAAGGLVFNQKQEALFIFRRGFWDLPKGKIDSGEEIPDAAVREVSEETGIQNIERQELLITTLHTYKNRKGKRCLKPTYWYQMKTTDTQLTPQKEEDIDLAEWISIEKFLKQHKKETFKSILEVIKTAKNKE